MLVRGAKPKSASSAVMSTVSMKRSHQACRRWRTAGSASTASTSNCTRCTAPSTDGLGARTHSSRWISQLWRCPTSASPPRAAARPRLQMKGRDGALEDLALVADAQIAALHAGVGRGQLAGAGVLEGLAGLQQRLAADPPQALDLFDMAQFVGDDPVARDQLARHLAGIGHGDRVGEGVYARRWSGLLWQKGGADLDLELVHGHGGNGNCPQCTGLSTPPPPAAPCFLPPLGSAMARPAKPEAIA